MTGFGEIDQNARFWAKIGYFWQFWPQNGKNGIFWENPKISLPYPYYAATLCKKPEQSYERILRSKMYVRTDVRTEADLKVPTASGGGPKIERLKAYFREKWTERLYFKQASDAGVSRQCLED